LKQFGVKRRSADTAPSKSRSSALLRFAVCVLLLGWAAAFAQTVNQTANQTASQTPSSGDNQTPFKLQVESNLVVVRVVARDAEGRPVESLHKEDFQLLDNGKEQAIAQFGVEAYKGPSSNSSATPTSNVASPVTPQHFVGIYFDDLSMPFDDVARARDAADRYLATALQPSDRAAIFTSSGSVALDFTSDLKQLHDALFKIRSSNRLGDNDCPKITDYQADRIVNHEDPDAYAVATDEATNVCNISAKGTPLNPILFAMAQRVLNQASWQAQYSLLGLNQLVKHMSEMPGQRNIILVSSGFLSEELQFQVDAVIDRALRSQVVISALDSKCLDVGLQESDIRTGYTTMDLHLLSVRRDFMLTRERMATSVLAQAAEDTGGEFFHNNNDLTLGFREAAPLSEFYYVLAFSPKNLKLDGRFHTLKVSLREKHAGVTLQARRGYFAPRKAADREDEVQEEIHEAVLSRVDTQQMPVDISTELSKISGKAEFAVMTHLDVKPIHFRRDGSRNVCTLTFVSTIFDHDGNWVTGQQQQARLNLLDATLHDMLTTGVVMRTTFQLAPGTYMLREVVTESEDHHLTALSRHIEIP
jgi:VWFA-related protein